MVMLTVPFALVGGVWFLGYNSSVAVWVGFIALAGVAAETGVVMLIYLDEAYQRQGALGRLRPVVMTVTAIVAALTPIMWSSGTGSETMKRIAAPMVGGMVTATVLTLAVIPAFYRLWRRAGSGGGGGSEGSEGSWWW